MSIKRLEIISRIQPKNMFKQNGIIDNLFDELTEIVTQSVDLFEKVFDGIDDKYF